jgi:hypothetical protein
LFERGYGRVELIYRIHSQSNLTPGKNGHEECMKINAEDGKFFNGQPSGIANCFGLLAPRISLFAG